MSYVIENNFDIKSETDGESVAVWDIEFEYMDSLTTFDITTESDDESTIKSDIESLYGDMVKGCLIKCSKCHNKKDAGHYGIKGNGDRLKTCNRCVEYMKEYVIKNK